MSRLLRLYPTRWRARYEVEMRDALAARPTTTRDQMDLLRGAVDAWLHPELVPARELVPAPIGAGLPPVGHGRRRDGIARTSSLLAAVCLGLCALIMIQRDGTLIGTQLLQGLLTAAGTLFLGVSIGLGNDSGRWVRIGAATLAAGSLLAFGFAAEGWWVLAMGPLTVGAGIVAVGSVLHDRGRRWWGLTMLVSLAILAVGARERLGMPLGVALLVVAFLGLSSGTPPGRLLRSPRAIAAVLVGVMVPTVLLGAMSPWRPHEDFALACAVPATECERAYVGAVDGLRRSLPGVDIVSVGVDADGDLSMCWRHPAESGGAACHFLGSGGALRPAFPWT